MLTADEAADIARRHGLGIGDAVALRTLADDSAHAERIAARFASPGASDGRDLAAFLFGPEPTTADPEPTTDTDEDTTTPVSSEEADRRDFANQLFRDNK